MRSLPHLLLIAALGLPGVATAQSFRSADTVIKRMWQAGMEQSQLERLGQVLIDSIGPRRSGSPGAKAVEGHVAVIPALAYPASEDRERTSREQAVLPGASGTSRPWPTCRPAQRSAK